MTLLVFVALYLRFPLPSQLEMPRFVPVCLSDHDTLRRNRQRSGRSSTCRG